MALGFWLKLAKKGAPERTLTKLEAVDAALCHGWIDGQLDTYDEYYWLIRFTPRKPRSKWSELNRRRATELLAEGRMRPAGLAQIEMAKTDGRGSEPMRQPAPPNRRPTLPLRSTQIPRRPPSLRLSRDLTATPSSIASAR